MVGYIPTVGDGQSYYLFVPFRATLYGRDYRPYRFLRIVDYTGIDVHTSVNLVDDPGDPSSVSIVETLDMKTFLSYISYGYTPYIEALYSGFADNGFDTDSLKRFAFTQAAIRDYESRCNNLLDLCVSKRYSIGKGMSSSTTSELVDELRGALGCWEMMMNVGSVSPKNVLLASTIADKKHGAPPIKQTREKISELQERMLVDNMRALPYKISDSDRQLLFSAYKVI